jgi:hypothetical protein
MRLKEREAPNPHREKQRLVTRDSSALDITLLLFFFFSIETSQNTPYFGSLDGSDMYFIEVQ